MIATIKKEVCGPCLKFVNIGQPILECQNCSTIIHTKCYKKAKFSCNIGGIWLCEKCLSELEPRYNPFCTWKDHESDKFYDNDGAGDDSVLQSISNTLDKCKAYNTHDFNNVLDVITGSQSNTKSPSNNILSSLFLNIDGNASNFDQFSVELERLRHKFSVVGLAETNIDDNLKNLYRIPNYNSYYQSAVEGKLKGSGVALYVHNSLNATVEENLTCTTPNIESLFVKITNTLQPKIFGVIYRPPSGDVNKFIEAFDELVSTLPKNGVYIMGDFNIDLLKKQCNTVADFEEAFLASGFAPLISIPTHERPNCKKSCIDNIITNDIENVILSGTLSDRLCHHLPIFQLTKDKLGLETAQEKHVQYYNFSNSNIRKFVDQLATKVSTLDTSKFSDFTDIFGSTLDATCKLEKPKVTVRTQQNKPWMTEGIKTAVDRKHELRINWSKTVTKKSPLGNELLHQQFSHYRKVLSKIIKSAKKSYYCNKLIENKEDRKKTWQIINELRGKCKQNIKPLFVIDNKRITDRRIIANEFNKYFNSIATKLNDSIIDIKIGDSKIQSFEDYLNPANKFSIFLEDCSPQEIMKIISDFENGKASDVPIRVIKRTAHVICPILAKYFNQSMSDGVFPGVLKVGKVTPIFKKGSSEDVGNYRPVSTLPIFGKIFEKIIYTRIYNFAISKSILNTNQFGFRKSHSTSHAINYSVSLIEESLRKQRHVLGIFIDLSKAFDTIDHKTLLVKLDRYGIRGTANKLIQSYLSNRTQYTEVLGEKSDVVITKYGVPQGSVLGPLLFLLYINDISNSSNLGDFVLFADDTNIFVDGASIDEAYSKGNALLRSVHKYMTLNKLHINMTKCCYIHFRPKNQRIIISDTQTTHKLQINNFDIMKTKETKFLGVIIDENLNWEAHIRQLRRKLNYASATLNRMRVNIPENLHKDLYYTLYESHLSYCISAWGGISQNKLSAITTAQKLCMRVLFGDREAFLEKYRTCARARPYGYQALGDSFFRKEHTKPIFKHTGILTVQNLYTYHCFMEIFKILKLRTPISIHSKYNISLRKNTTLITPVPSHHFTYKSAIIWNVIQPQLKIYDYSTSISLTKNKLKTLLFQNQHSHDHLEWLPNDFAINKLNKN